MSTTTKTFVAPTLFDLGAPGIPRKTPRARPARPANPDQLSLLDLLPPPELVMLADYWRDANERWFGGQLTPVPFIADYTSPPGLLGAYGFRRRTWQRVITINGQLLENLDEPGPYLVATDVVLHEMVHQYIDTCTSADEPSHGPTFTAMCNKIGAQLGLCEVTQRKPRGRQGRPSRYWPTRPEGAYGLDNPHHSILVRRMIARTNLKEIPK
jgi:hypothetical protein